MKDDLLQTLIEAHGMSRDEFDELIEQMKKDPVGFIIDESDSEIAKKKNIAKSIYQLLHLYKVVEKPEANSITFLGVAAGGYAIAQGMRTGGFVLNIENKMVHVDPGVSAIKDCRDYALCGGRIDPILTDILLVTHNHIDHAGGVEEYTELWLPFSKLLRKTIVANETVVNGNPRFDQGPRIDKYKKAKINTYALHPGETLKIDDLTIKATKAIHVEAFDTVTGEVGGNCIGFIVETPFGTVCITGDSEYYDSMAEEYADADYLIAYIVQERSRIGSEPERFKFRKRKMHSQFLGEVGVETILSEVKPKICFITHYGDQLATFRNGKIVFKEIPEAIARRIEKNTGIKTIASLNGMTFHIEKNALSVNWKYFYM
ncbi:MAG TPA: MBL fold metallo-hydrolase [Desulfobacteraceae bacterium]|nr:MBL fold metallo-hydrolase [Desulfobacteraceae bacterium]